MEFDQSWSKSRFSSKCIKSFKGQGKSNGFLATIVKDSICIKIDQILETHKAQPMHFYQSWSKSNLKRQHAANAIVPKFVKVSMFINIDQILKNTRRSPWNFTKVGKSQDVLNLFKINTSLDFHQHRSNP